MYGAAGIKGHRLTVYSPSKKTQMSHCAPLPKEKWVEQIMGPCCIATPLPLVNDSQSPWQH